MEINNNIEIEQVERMETVVEPPTTDNTGTPVASPPLGPRERLEQLLVADRHQRRRRRMVDDNDREIKEREIIELARTHPEVFAEEFVYPDAINQGYGPEEDRRSPLSYTVLFLKQHDGTVNIDLFEAVYSAHPAAIDSVDSFQDTVLLEILESHYLSRHDGLPNPRFVFWFDLLKSIISKSPHLLAIGDQFHFPVMKAVERGLDQDVVQFMIDHHPGDPFRELAKANKLSLLGAAVRQRNCSVDFVKYIFDMHPEAARIQQTDKYQRTILYAACYRGDEDIIKHILDSYPEEASVPMRRKELPLHAFFDIGHYCSIVPESLVNAKSSVAMVAVANPKAIFQKTYDSESGNRYSPFSLLVKAMLRCTERDPDQNAEEDDLLWSYLYFFMNVHLHGTGIDTKKAWTRPQYPVHAAARCPCPTDFLIYMAKENPDQLLQLDDERRSVFALALESGHETCCIQQLVNIDHSAIGMLDPKTGLYPFMTAAYSEAKIAEMTILDCWIADDGSDYGKDLGNEARAGASLKCLNTIFILLRADPSKVIANLDHSIKNSMHLTTTNKPTKKRKIWWPWA